MTSEKHTEKQWELYGNAVDELDSAFYNMLEAMDSWIKNAAPITLPDNVQDMKEFRKEFKETIKDFLDQHILDLKLYE